MRRRVGLGYLIVALLLVGGGVALAIGSKGAVLNDYYESQMRAALKMEECELYIKEDMIAHSIINEDEDIYSTYLLGPEFTELTSTPGNPEAKRTSLHPDFAALMVKYYKEAGLKEGDTIAIGSSGSFPGLLIAALVAADELKLNVELIASLGASMHGATRVNYNIFDILSAIKRGGFSSFNLLAVSRGGYNDKGGGALEGVIYSGTQELSRELCERVGAPFIDIENLEDNIQYRLSLYSKRSKLFINIGGASTNNGASSYTLSFPNGLVRDFPKIPTVKARGLIYEFAARGVPVINLLNVRGLAEANGIPFDSAPHYNPSSSVYYRTSYNRVLLISFLLLSLVVLVLGVINGRKKSNH